MRSLSRSRCRSRRRFWKRSRGQEGRRTMNKDNGLSRRSLLARACAGACAFTLAGCQRLTGSPWFSKVLGVGEKVSYRAHRMFLPRRAMAQEFGADDRSPHFRSNGTAEPSNPAYQALAESGFAGYRLQVGGLVERPTSLSLADL